MTIKEYWNLNDQEPFLAITSEPDFSQACSFRRMLMNHKNFHFTQISDKTNDMVFLKSPKTMFLGHFWPFFPDGDFFQKIRLPHATIYGPLTPCHIWTPKTPNTKFSEKNWANPEKTYGQTEGWMERQKDGRTDLFFFVGAFWHWGSNKKGSKKTT